MMRLLCGDNMKTLQDYVDEAWPIQLVIDEPLPDDHRYYISLRSHSHYKKIKAAMVEFGDVVKASDVVFVSLNEKNRQAVLKNVERVPMSHLIGQWRKSELINLSFGSSEEYDEELIKVQDAQMKSIMDKFGGL